jgi:adenylate cyclase
MAKEIERKFLVDRKKWGKTGNPVKMQQAYIVIENNIVVRVRIAGKKAFLTIKGNLQGISRDEFEYEIPVSDAVQLFDMRIGSLISKTRYYEQINGKTWETDVFEGDNSGLIVAEIELEEENEVFEKPLWISKEVSTDQRYFNFNLSQTPYSKWNIF